MPRMNRTLVRVHGQPPWMSWRNASGLRGAAGLAQGGPADASSGMSILNDDRGSWAYNTVYGQWMLLHIIRSGDTLWGLSGTYYGERSMAGVHLIGNVEQNRPILGSSYDKAVPGDVILIPDLQQPGAAPPSPGPPAAQPAPGGGVPVPGPDEGPVSGGGVTIPGLPEQPPPGWPVNLPWPPLGYDETDPGAGVEPTPVGGGTGAEPILTGGAPIEPAPAPASEPSWWTTPRIALVGGLGVVTVGLIVWGATRGSKRSRRSAPRRRRRRR